jgi:hypothetical protein
VQPFTLDDPAAAASVSIAIGISLLIAVVAFLKRRILLGAVGLFIVPLGLYAAVRVGHPHSPWARWFYRPGSRRLARAEERFNDPDRWSARWQRRLLDAVGGTPTKPNSG